MSRVIPPLQVTGPECVFVHTCVKVNVSRAMAWIELFMKHVYSFCFTRVLSHLPLYMPVPTTPQSSSSCPSLTLLPGANWQSVSWNVSMHRHSEAWLLVHIIFYTRHLCSTIKASTRRRLNEEIFICCDKGISWSEYHKVAQCSG